MDRLFNWLGVLGTGVLLYITFNGKKTVPVIRASGSALAGLVRETEGH